VLDRAPTGCQTHPSNWFDHWASVSRGHSAGMGEEGMEDAKKGDVEKGDVKEGDTITFTANGSPQVVSRAIEEYARSQGHLSAIVVPWESDGTTLSMAVTAVKSDGWAIEHTNLGTIRLIDAGREQTEVAIAAEPSEDPEHQKLAALFERFVRQVQSRFHVES
jgi:hypothetical protein